MIFRLMSLLRIVLTIFLIGIPLGISLFFLGKRFLKGGAFVIEKAKEVKTLDNMRKEILQKRVQENQEDNIRDGFDSNIEFINEKIKDNLNGDNCNIQIDPNLDKSIITDEIKENVVKKSKELIQKEKKLLEKINYEALILKKDGKLEQYEQKLIEGLAIDPINKEINQMLADLYFTIGNHNKALSLLKKIIELDSKNHNAIWQLGEIYLITGDFDTAELLVEKSIVLSPANPKYYISLVEIYYNTDRIKDSINIMEKVVRLRPTNANYIYTLANLYEEINDLDNAKKYYFRVLECEPSNEKAKKKLKNLS